jgi:hypothetical protein
MSTELSAAAAIVQAQLAAYNSRDLEAFTALFADDASIFELGATTPSVSGKAGIRNRYASVFASSPNLHSEVLSRVCLGSTVIDLERITGREGSTETLTLLAIYQVHEGAIQRVHFARE